MPGAELERALLGHHTHAVLPARQLHARAMSCWPSESANLRAVDVILATIDDAIVVFVVRIDEQHQLSRLGSAHRR